MIVAQLSHTRFPLPARLKTAYQGCKVALNRLALFSLASLAKRKKVCGVH